MECRRASWDPHWCQVHKAEFSSEDQLCEHARALANRLRLIRALLFAIDTRDWAQCERLGALIYASVVPSAVG